MRLLLVAGDDAMPSLAAHFSGEFEVAHAATGTDALASLRQQPADALVVHLGIGESDALDVLYGARKLTPDRPPGMVVVAGSFQLRTVVEVMRAGAYDVQVESELPPGKLAHSVRNAMLLTQLGKRRADPAKKT